MRLDKMVVRVLAAYTWAGAHLRIVVGCGLLITAGVVAATGLLTSATAPVDGADAYAVLMAGIGVVLLAQETHDRG